MCRRDHFNLQKSTKKRAYVSIYFLIFFSVRTATPLPITPPLGAPALRTSSAFLHRQDELYQEAEPGGAGVAHAPLGHTDGHDYRLRSEHRLFKNKDGSSTAEKAFRKAILTAEIAENHSSFPGSAPDPLAWGEARCTSPRTPHPGL